MDIKSKPELFFIAHRMNVGSSANRRYNQVDNGMEALDSFLEITGKDYSFSHIKGFECDVRLTSDNELVVLHDANAKTMTKTRLDKNIGAMTYEELSNIELLNAGLYYKGLKKRALFLPDSKRTRRIIEQKLQQKTTVPKAFEMFEHLVEKGYSKEIVLELKEATDKNRDAMIELINTFKTRLNIVAKGYDAKRIIEIGEKTGVKIGQLEAIKFVNQEKDIDAEYIKNMPFDFYSILWTKVTNEKLSALVENGKALYTWTIDSAAHLFMLLNKLERFYNINGSLPQNIHLITNIPILLEEYIAKTNNRVSFTKNINLKYRRLFEAI